MFLFTFHTLYSIHVVTVILNSAIVTIMPNNHNYFGAKYRIAKS